ncbi:hypothetical protein LOTGIDRAFT_161036 [Lottia gigantea]|uniref:Uncharacterized protein n=1 Tax=Lottia gigantea TaxID=225164 RepID=V4AHV7_LOTGI|nr:hypothetical protein LOTGIDRAFT_161036 [Lottia gigantea]ESO94785.1 hypothetical protein LOTGIDRAFT_161036 [Lottia gigantea]
MSDLDSEYSRAESGRPFRQEENKEFVKLFNEQKFRPRTAILKVWFEYPTNMFFQPIPAKDKISFTNRIAYKFPPVTYPTTALSSIDLYHLPIADHQPTHPAISHPIADLPTTPTNQEKPWVKSFTNGVVIPKDDDKQNEVFRSYLNLVKRKAPDNEGIIYTYNDGKELDMDENYEFDDYDYLTIQEENEEC